MMENTFLTEFLDSEAACGGISSERILEHFSQKYMSVPYQNHILFIFNHDRAFANRNHTIELHKKNNGIVPWHIYHYIVITYCYSGQMVLHIDEQIVTLKEGDLLIMDRHVPHKVEPTGPHDLGVNIILSDRYFSAAFTNRLARNSLLRQFFFELMQVQGSHIHYLIIHTGDDLLTKQCIDCILTETFHPRFGNDDIVDNFIMILLTHLERLEERQTNLVVKGSRNAELADDILLYIHRNYKNGNLSEMCSHFGYESSYASKVIKAQTGKTFKELVNDRRMKVAYQLLKKENIPVYEIAEAVGITNLTTFYKRFEACYGKTPKAMRDAFQQEENRQTA